MSSVNPYYTFNYSQPEEYRFSHDSVFLARRVFELLKSDIKPEWRILDLCAGCGIVGMDFLFHCDRELGLTPTQCDFIEVQNEYENHFYVNQQLLGLPRVNLRLLQKNFNDVVDGEYELILCNPPYFDPTAGKLSPSTFKNRCRFFMDATESELMASIHKLLAPQGRAYVLSRKPSQGNIIGDIRGTPLVLLKKMANSNNHNFL